jgi:hypothetical protein
LHDPGYRSDTPAGDSRPLAPSSSATSGLSLITEPGAGDQPFIALIDSVRRSVRITMYELEDQRVEQALAVTASRGVHVMVLLDHGYDGVGRPGNQAAYNYLRAHDVTVAWAPRYFRVAAPEVDRDRPAHGGDHDAESHILHYSSSRDLRCRIASLPTWRRSHRCLTPTSAASRSPRVWVAGIWCGAPAQTEITALTARTRLSLDLESEEMQDPAETHQLCQDARHGVRVRVLMTYQPAWRAALNYLVRKQRDATRCLTIHGTKRKSARCGANGAVGTTRRSLAVAADWRAQ